jgi:putative salt-induced outer membrane protein YdiY
MTVHIIKEEVHMRRITPAAFVFLLVNAVQGGAQTPPAAAAAPPDAVTGNVTVGLALTSGNKDTTTFNAGYEFKYDPKTKNVVKSTGLFLYGKSDSELTAEQYGLVFRDEYSLSPRAFVFGEFRYLHDKFKGIDYLLSPTGGAGYKLVDAPATSLAVSAGVGAVSEKDTGFDLSTTGAVTFDEKLAHKLSATATVGQTFAALWKTSDFGDALYGFGVNLAATVTGRAQLTVELRDTYKVKPPDPTLKKNDVTLIMGAVYKF